MKFFYSSLIIFLFCFTLTILPYLKSETSTDQSPANVVVPNSYVATNGTSTFLGPFANAQRTYQFLIHANQLASITGKFLTGIKMRIPASATADWPLADVTYSNYDIYLSGSVDPVNRSLTFANNVVGTRTQVRSGSLFIPANSYTFGGSPNAFGPVITFNTPWYYSGGNLLIELRHQGFTGTSRSVDAISTTTTGYAADFSACWTGSYTGTAGSQGNFSVVDIQAIDPPFTLSLTGLIEGMYDGGSNTMVPDAAKVHIRNSTSPYAIVETFSSNLNANGNGTFYFATLSDGVPYYIVVNQRNSVNTWSASGESFSSGALSYDFTTAASQAYGGNQTLKGSRYTIYSGDVTKDGAVDGSDLSLIDNAAAEFLSGYYPEDLNGDTIVDGSDGSICENNAANFVNEQNPL